MPKICTKYDTLVNQSPKGARRKLYTGRIKPTKGLFDVGNPTTKAISHRIVRRKMEREMNKELKDL